MEIRGLSTSPLATHRQGSKVEVLNTAFTLENEAEADQAFAFYVDSYDSVSFKKNTVNISNAKTTSIIGYYSISNNTVDIADNTMAITGGSYESVKAIDVTADNTSKLITVNVKGNHLSISNVKNPSAEFVGIHLHGYSEDDYEGINLKLPRMNSKDSF